MKKEDDQQALVACNEVTQVEGYSFPGFMKGLSGLPEHVRESYEICIQHQDKEVIYEAETGNLRIVGPKTEITMTPQSKTEIVF